MAADGLPGSVVRAWVRHPRWGMVVKAAVAASLAWALVQLVPGAAGDYPYYAPLGAVVATSATLARSVREAAQTVGAIGLGAAVALVVDGLSYPNAVTIAVVVAAGVALAGWSALGTSGTWVPTSALFTLIIGDADPVGYVAGYAGLTLLGALVGLAVTAAFPPLPMVPAQAELDRLRDLLADQLEDLVDALRRTSPPDEAGWRARMRSVDPVLSRMRDAVALADQGRRGNRRARRYAGAADRLYRRAKALESLAFLVVDLVELLREHETAAAGWDDVALGPRLRPTTATALAALAGVVRTDDRTDDRDDDREQARSAQDAVDDLARELRAERERTGHDLFVAGSVLTTVRRSLHALAPGGPDRPTA